MKAITEIVGLSTIGITCLLGAITLASAIYLIVKVRRLPTMAAFIPVAAAPAVLGVFQTALSFVRELSVCLETGANDMNLVLLLALCFVPTIFGLLASLPAYLAISIGLFVQTLQIPQDAAASSPHHPKSKWPSSSRRSSNRERREAVAESGSYLTLDAPEDIDY
ncbi:hypothetical protein EC9_15030 [Rosistilla ulvae]|uniref:Uncharacterized protein n=1 Tax=Rosistilla ulvae TaxID=1930277 RepID=A0A517LXH5_9BACT|nr:hypothetical protein [Rosistilla ulvae]QDS87325.1 hypothetical protein EC9_15030 [Rosistilla ulvae]